MAPHPAIPAQGVQQLFSSNDLPPALYTVGEPYSTSSVTSSTLFVDSVLLMLLLARRWLGAYISFGSVGWLWHRSVASLNYLEECSTNERAGAGETLNGWNAAVCKGIFIYDNVFGDKRGAGEEDKGVLEGKRPKVPNFVIDYGESFPLPPTYHREAMANFTYIQRHTYISIAKKYSCQAISGNSMLPHDFRI